MPLLLLIYCRAAAHKTPADLNYWIAGQRKTKIESSRLQSIWPAPHY